MMSCKKSWLYLKLMSVVYYLKEICVGVFELMLNTWRQIHDITHKYIIYLGVISVYILSFNSTIHST